MMPHDFVRILVLQERFNRILGFCTIRKGGIRGHKTLQAASTPVL